MTFDSLTSKHQQYKCIYSEYLSPKLNDDIKLFISNTVQAKCQTIKVKMYILRNDFDMATVFRIRARSIIDWILSTSIKETGRGFFSN